MSWSLKELRADRCAKRWAMPASRAALAGVLLAGTALRVWQYAGNDSLWFDELALARNIVDHPLGTLLAGRLDYNQVAPPGFLLCEKIAVISLGGSEASLRLFPLFCGLVSLWLFGRVAARVLSGWAVPFSVGLFAFAPILLFRSAEVKQYSTDLAASLLLTLIALDLRSCRGVSGRSLSFGIIGAALTWFSQPAALMLVGLGMALVLVALAERNRDALHALFPVLTLWGAGAAAAVLAGLHHMTPLTRSYMFWFWQFDFPPRSVDAVLWLWHELYNTWDNSSLYYPLAGLYVVLLVIGFCALGKRQCELALILFGPIAVTLAASAVRLYPFSDRLITFLLPAFFLAAAEGVDWLRSLWLPRAPTMARVTMVLFTLPPLVAIAGHLPVYRTEEMKPMLAYLEAHHRTGDAIYVYYGAAQGYGFYARHFGLRPEDAVIGGCHSGELRTFLHELDPFRGRARLWVLFAHDSPRPLEKPTIKGYLNQIGMSRDEIHFPGDFPSWREVEADLYDLSGSERLASTSAEGFPVPSDPHAEFNRLSCKGGPQVPVPPNAH